jgi:hypothetical protein
VDFKELIREIAPKRSDGTAFPVKAPSGWVHLSGAITRMAALWLNPEPSERAEFYRQTVDLFKATDLPDEAAKVRDNLAREFCKVCFEGNLLTGFRRIGASGPVEPIDPDWWELEDDLAPFRSWGFDPDNPSNPTPKSWIWVDRVSLDEQLNVAARGHEPVKFFERGRMIRLRGALDLLERFIEDRKGPPAPLGAPDGARELKALCESGKVRSLAGYMVRSIRADVRGEKGINCAARNNWLIPPEVWAGVALSPIQNWASGLLLSKPDQRNTYRLKNVLVDRLDLLQHMESLGLLWRAQWRFAGSEEIIAEGFILPEVEPQHDATPERLPPADAFPSDDVAAPKNLKTVSPAKLSEWVRQMLNRGHTARELIQLRVNAFPNNASPSKRQVEEVYRNLFSEDFGEFPKPGSMHPGLKERRMTSGLDT